jgi:hypothetical protein
LRDDTRPARATRRGQRARRAVLTSLSRNLTIEDPTDVGFLTGFGAVIFIDVATQGRKAPVAKKYAAAAVWHAMAATSGADLPAATMPLVFGMTLCQANPELIENTLSSLSPEMRTLLQQQHPESSPPIPPASTAHPSRAEASRSERPEMITTRTQIPEHQKEKQQ